MNEHVLPLSEYPRPDLARDPWMSLDGEWDFVFDRLDVGIREEWFRSRTFRKKIRVPFCVESPASGVGDTSPPKAMWYQRTFDPASISTPGRRLLLHFGAADYATRVWLNGEFIGRHEGGYTPFVFDITDRVVPGDNTLTVRVRDSLDPRIPRGKQSCFGRPTQIFYTTVSGIWQSVWLESAGGVYLKDYAVTTDPDTGVVTVRCRTAGDGGNISFRVEASDPDGATSAVTTDFSKIAGESTLVVDLHVDAPRSWSPKDPALYSISFTILDDADREIDRVSGYFGFRRIEVKDGRVLLNGKPLYQKLLLAQGYFPEGHYTPTDWAEFRRDVDRVKEMGFNGVRMHQKIENPKFLFWCDALGCLVWEEMPSAFLWSSTMRRAVAEQWREVIARDRNHPCIIAWVPFNESWGFVFMLGSARVRQYVVETVEATKSLDPTRLVVDNSGFEHVKTDLLDMHHYLGTLDDCREYYRKLREPGFLEFRASNIVGRLNVAKTPVSPLAPGIKYGGEPMMISEYGGFGFYKAKEKPLIDNFRDYTMAIAEDDLFHGYAYTQFADTEQEANGLLTMDREPKEPIEDIRRVSDAVDEIVRKRFGE